jgi:hypothetical protein
VDLELKRRVSGAKIRILMTVLGLENNSFCIVNKKTDVIRIQNNQDPPFVQYPTKRFGFKFLEGAGSDQQGVNNKMFNCPQKTFFIYKMAVSKYLNTLISSDLQVVVQILSKSLSLLINRLFQSI